MLWMPPTPAIIIPKPPELVRATDPLIVGAMLPGLAGLAGKGAVATGGGAPTPPLSNMVGWWDASVTSSFTLSSTTVTAWADQTGTTGSNLGDGVATANRPTYSATSFNTSYPGVTFSGGHSIVSQSNSFKMGTGNELTFYVVGTMTSATSNFGRTLSYYSNVASDYSDPGNWIFIRNGTAQQTAIMRNSVLVSQNMTYATPTIWIGTIDSSGVITIYTNNVASTTGTSSGNWRNNGTLGVGASVSDGGTLDGIIAEAGISTSYINSTAVTTLYNSLKTKWGM